MRRYFALFAACSLLTFAGTAAAGMRGVPPQFPRLAAGKWSHAEINAKIKGRWHTVILDHGQIVQATPAQLTLREFDGTIAAIPIDDQTVVTGPGQAFLRKGMYAEAMRIDGGPAVRVRVTFRP